MNILDSINNTIKQLDEIEDYSEKLPDLQSHIDSKLCDLLHYIEHHKLKTNECYRIVKEIKSLRETRRELNNNNQILLCYKNHLLKLNNKGNRSMLLAELNKVNKRLNQPYKNRVYTETELSEMLGVKEEIKKEDEYER